MKISIIIPTLNEEKRIAALIRYLKQDPSFPLIKEIMVVDASSSDGTASQALSEGVRVINSPFRQRAYQMNLAAAQARGQILYFLHADTKPPCGFAQQIWQAYLKGHRMGCFRLKFDWSHWFLSFNSWFTRFNLSLLRFGDQSLFVEKKIFNSSNGFNDQLKMFEDQDIIYRAKINTRFLVLPGYVITSARKYRENGPYRLQLAYFFLYLCYRMGVKQGILQKLYLKMVPFPRL